MSEQVDALAEKVRDGLRVPPEGHHPVCESRSGGDCDCYMRRYTPALDALDELVSLALREARDERG